jgi:hypothetical protein
MSINQPLGAEIMQRSESVTSDNLLPAVAAHRMPGVERSRRSTAILLWLGMAAVYVLSAVVWLHFLRHGYSAKR